MPLEIRIIENVLHLVPDPATGTWTLRYSPDGGTTWHDWWQLDYVNNVLKILSKIADDVKQTYGSGASNYSVRFDSTADAWIVRDETNGVDVLIVKRNGDIEIGRDLAVDRNLSVTGTTSLGGSVIADITIEKGTPKIVFKGTETGAGTFSIREDTGKIVIRDEVGAADVVKIDIATGNVELIGNFLQDVIVEKATPGVRLKGTETGAGDLGLRENAGKVEIYDYAGAAVKVADLINRTGLRDSDTVSCSIGTGGAANETFTTILSLGIGKTHMFPKAAVLTIGGTPGTTETVTVNLYVRNDAGTRILIYSYSLTGGTGSITLNEGDITAALITNGAAADIEGHRIVAIDVGAYTNATSTTATASARVIAEET